MDLLLDEEQSQIVDSTASFARKELPLERLHEKTRASDFVDDSVWSRIAGMGWLGMTLSEASGGVGYSEIEEMLVFHELGRVCAPLEIMSTVLAAKIGDAAGQHELAASLAAGQAVAALTVNRDPTLDAEDLSSQMLFGGSQAGYAVHLTKGWARLIDLQGTDIIPVPNLDKSVRLGETDLRNKKIVAQAPGERILQTANLLVSAQLQGAAEEVMNLITEYAKVRETFGRPIAAYQAVSHPIANMKVRCEAARAQLYYASLVLAETSKGGTRDADLHVSSARLLCEDTALRNVEDNIQLHGGIAVTDEFTAHFFLKRVHVLKRMVSNAFTQSEIVLNAKMTPF